MDSYPVSLLERPQAVSGRPLSARTRPASCFHNRNCERPVENLPGLEETFRLYPLTAQLRCWLTVRPTGLQSLADCVANPQQAIENFAVATGTCFRWDI